MDSKKKRNRQPRKRFQKNSFDRKDNRHNPGKKTFRHVDQVTEAEVGITEFISNLDGFSGVLKARYSDFHVSEVDPNGVIAVLNDIKIPEETNAVDFNTIEESPIDILPKEIWQDIKEMVSTGSKECVKFEATSLTKDERKNLHSKVKEIFGKNIDSSTILEDGINIVVFKKPTHGCRETYVWPEGRGHYVHFILYKEALDTMTACYKVADVINIRPSNISYAGIKDKRAKTTQWMCVKQVDPHKLMTRSKPFNNIKIGNITFKDNPLKLGDLSGNRFKIVIRNVVVEDAVIEKSIEFARDNGFVNYYGLQRFGNDKEAPTYTVGVKLLLGNWKEACELILKPKKSDDPLSDVAHAKKVYNETMDSGKAFKCLGRSRNNCVEARLLQGLMKEKNNYVNALESIPRNMRLLYIHSFQSLVWNKMVTARIKKYGLKPVVNDLVLINDEDVEPPVDVPEARPDDEQAAVEKEADSQKLRQAVKALTEEELSKYTIYDIVLPLPGYDIDYPEHLKEDYKEELEKHGLTLEMPKQKVRTYTLSGAYRKILGRIQDFQWKIMKYNDPNTSLVLSDYEKLRNFDEPADIPDGQYKAVIVEFTLDPSVYATMVLREIMKIDTSPSAQAKMNDYSGGSDTTKTDKPNRSLTVTDDNIKEEEKEENNGLAPNSLLTNKEKMEEFKRCIYGDSTKRKIEEDDKEKTSPKKQKIAE